VAGPTQAASGGKSESPKALRPLSEFGLDDQQIWGLVDAAPDAMVMVDEAGKILLVNRQTEELFGYERSELLGRPIEELLPEQLRQVHKAHRTRYRAAPRTRPMGASMTLAGRRRDGTEFPVEVSLSPLEIEGGLRVVAAARDISERVETEERLRRAAQDLHLLEDRERIARDLHDLVIQRLFAAGITLQATCSMIDDPSVAQRVGAAVDELDETIREIRTVIFGLQADSAQRSGLRGDILRIVSDERHVLGFEPRVHFDGPIDAVSDEIGEQLCATLREALSNVARHAHAASADVSVLAGDQVVLRIVDDGAGIPAQPGSGQGLGNMAERAERLGGSFRTSRGPERGTVIEWSVPNR
jgi:two-component system, NarL family, sensor histidine kinase DevS